MFCVFLNLIVQELWLCCVCVHACVCKYMCVCVCVCVCVVCVCVCMCVCLRYVMCWEHVSLRHMMLC